MTFVALVPACLLPLAEPEGPQPCPSMGELRALASIDVGVVVAHVSVPDIVGADCYLAIGSDDPVFFIPATDVEPTAEEAAELVANRDTNGAVRPPWSDGHADAELAPGWYLACVVGGYADCQYFELLPNRLAVARVTHFDFQIWDDGNIGLRHYEIMPAP